VAIFTAIRRISAMPLIRWKSQTNMGVSEKTEWELGNWVFSTTLSQLVSFAPAFVAKV
jgi:hypothetical protein